MEDVNTANYMQKFGKEFGKVLKQNALVNIFIFTFKVEQYVSADTYENFFGMS